MRITSFVAAAALAGCSSLASSPALSVPNASMPNRAVVPAATTAGIYAVQESDKSVFGYKGNDKDNAPPVCGESPFESVYDVAADPNGNLIVPRGYPDHQISIYKGPQLCGPSVARFEDPYGQPVDAVSANALTGKIVVANIFDNGHPTPIAGSVSLCSRKKNNCTVNLTNPQMYEVAAVALDKAGDCWASATDASGSANLTYFARCAGKGRAATGYQNSSYGGLEVDKSGNLLALDYKSARLFVYSGCNPGCKLVAGPFTLKGTSIYGKLNSRGTTFAAADYELGQIDLYKYDGTSLTYEFSFNQDLSTDVEGVAYTPAL